MPKSRIDNIMGTGIIDELAETMAGFNTKTAEEILADKVVTPDNAVEDAINKFSGEDEVDSTDTDPETPEEDFVDEFNVYSFAVETKEADPEAKKAQESRSEKYGIAVKDGGNITKPSEFSGVEDKNWGDPVNYKLPMGDVKHTQNAASRVAQDKFRKSYTSKELSIIEGRVQKREKELGIGEDKKDDDKKSEENVNTDNIDESIDKKEYNKGEGTDPNVSMFDIESGFLSNVKAGSLLVLSKKDDKTTFELISPGEKVEELKMIIGRVTDEISETTSQYSLQGVEKSFTENGVTFFKADFEDVTFSITDSDTDQGICILSWTGGKVALDAEGVELTPANEKSQVPTDATSESEDKVEEAFAAKAWALHLQGMPDEEIAKNLEKSLREVYIALKEESDRVRSKFEEKISELSEKKEENPDEKKEDQKDANPEDQKDANPDDKKDENPDDKKDASPDDKKDENPDDKKDESPDSTKSEEVDKDATPDLVKEVTVADQLYDEPMTWQLYDLYSAFITAVQKLYIASEVTDEPVKLGQINTLIDELAALMKQVYANDDDVEDTDEMTEKSAKRIAELTLKGMMGLKKNVDFAQEMVKVLHDNPQNISDSLTETKSELEAKTKELEELTSKYVDLEEKTKTAEEEVTRLDGEVKAKSEELDKINAEIQEHQEVEKRWKELTTRSLPTPDKTRPDIVVDRLLRPESGDGYKSILDMTNEEILEMRDKRY